MRERLFIVGIFLLLGLGPSANAAAYDDRVTVGLDAGYARTVAGDEAPSHGPNFGISSSLGLTDIWTFRSRLGYAYHPGDAALQVGVATAEMLYLLDILQFVPFFGVGLDAFGTFWQGDFGADVGAHAVIGVDYLAGWDWLVGLDLRSYFLVPTLASGRIDPVYFTANLRISFLFDR